MSNESRHGPWSLVLMLESFGLLLFELLLTRIFAIVMFAQFAHLAISLTLLGIAVGALLVHLFPAIAPADKLPNRLGLLALIGALAMVVATVLAVQLEFTGVSTDVFDSDSAAFLKRRARASDLANSGSLALLYPIVSIPFICCGASFASIFRHFRERIGALYAADLCGGALGCLAFIPVLSIWSGPDSVFVAAFMACLAALALFRSSKSRLGLGITGAALIALAAVAAFATRGEVLPIHHAAGFNERYVTDVRWTPLTRIAVWEPPQSFDTFIMLDNTSRSRVVTDEAAMQRYFKNHAWSTAFRLIRKPGKVMILAAGAGGEVTAARQFGHYDITAVELVGSYFDIVRTRFAKVKGNPYLQPGVRRVVSDARAAVMHSRERFDLIEVMRANFFSFGGMLSEAWDPKLLFTKEAFEDYLDHLTPDGMVSIGGGPATYSHVKTAIAALRDRGVRSPLRHIAWIGGRGRRNLQTLLVRPRPFTGAERDKLMEVLRESRHELWLDPGWARKKAEARIAKRLARGFVLTDDHPYNDTPASYGLGKGSVEPDTASRNLHRVLLTQVGLLLGFGFILLGVPYVWRGRSALGQTKGSGRALWYCAALGYGFMGIEIVLMHELVLFVGHPTYAVTVVILSLLLGSGLGSLTIARVDPDRLDHWRRVALPTVILAAALHAFVISPFLDASGLALPLAQRIAIAAATLLPLGFALGMPFPLGMRILPVSAGPVVPWCWAINGWTSVVSAVLSILIARMFGYRVALSVALAAYVVAYLVSAGLHHVAVGSSDPAPAPAPAPPEPAAASLEG